MRILITLATILLPMACTSGGSPANQQSPAEIKARSTPVGVGEVAPDFTLEDQNRNKVTFSEVITKHNG
jgi:hypothetical protein